MSCTLEVIAACLSWSGLYVDAGIAAQDRHVPSQITLDRYGTLNDGRPLYTRAVVSDYASNPYGRLSLGYALEFRSVTWIAELSHVSSIRETSERGVNAIELRARWYPFR